MTNDLSFAGPGMAAFLVGQNNSLGQQTELLRQQQLKELVAEMAQKRGFDAQLQPLEVAQRQQNLDFDKQVKMPRGLEALTTERLANEQTRGTLPGLINATNATNATKVAAAGEEQQNSFQRRAINIGNTLNTVPPVMRRQALDVAFQREGIDSNSPQAQAFKARLEKLDPAMWPKVFDTWAKQLGTTQANMDPAQSTNRYGTDERAASARYAADKHLEGVKYSTDGRLQAVQEKFSQMEKTALTPGLDGKLNYEKAATLYELRAAMEEDPVKKAQYQKLAKTFAAEVLKKGKPTPQIDLNAMGVQTLPPSETGLGAGAPAAQQPTKPASLADVQKMYPGIPADKLQEAYKKKFGVDLK